jgi:two-component system, cell cycle response regulator
MKLMIRLATELQLPQTLEEMLQRVADRSAAILGVPHISLRLLDTSRTRLLIGCRAGESLHGNTSFEFRMGQGLVGWVAETGRVLRTGSAEADPRFLKREDARATIGSFLGVPLLHAGKVIGVLAAVSLQPDAFTEEHEGLGLLIAGLCAPHLEVARLARLDRVDPLTNTLNARGLDETFPELVGKSDAATVLSILLVDVDGFGQVNERYGQASGDEVLKAVARTLAGSLRVGDAVVRFGSDEFLLVIAGVGAASASRVAERVRSFVDAGLVRTDRGVIHVTVSIGVAERKPGETRDSVVRRAAAALEGARSRSNSVRVG